MTRNADPSYLISLRPDRRRSLPAPTRDVWSKLLIDKRNSRRERATERERRSVVQRDVEQRAMDLQPAVVLDEA